MCSIRRIYQIRGEILRVECDVYSRILGVVSTTTLGFRILSRFSRVVWSQLTNARQNPPHLVGRPRKCKETCYRIQDGQDPRDDTGAMEREEDHRLYHTPRYYNRCSEGTMRARTLTRVQDTGKPVFLPFRMSSFVLTNLVVTAGMLTPGLGVRTRGSILR